MFVKITGDATAVRIRHRKSDRYPGYAPRAHHHAERPDQRPPQPRAAVLACCCVCGLSLVDGLCCWHSAGAHGVGWSRGSSADSSPLRLGPDPPSPPDGDQVMSRRSQREIRFVSSPTLGSGPPSLLPEVVPPSGPQSVSLCSSFSEPPP